MVDESAATELSGAVADDENAEKGRRSFVKLGVASVAAAGLGTAVFGYQFLVPKVLYEPSPIVNAGKLDAYTAGSVTLRPESGIFIVNAAEGFYALDAVCTHLGCMTQWAPQQGGIFCPCHGSKFTSDGKVVEGPAPSPLPWLKLWISDAGDLMVDRSISVAPGQFVRV